MITFAKQHHKEGIIALWQEAFGDSKEEIELILKEVFENMAVFEKDGEVAGMLMILPVWCEGKKGGYVYAVATLKKYRSQGIAASLLNFAKAQGRDFLVLVPQSESLFDFYRKNGFHSINCIQKGRADAKKSAEFEFFGITAKEYYEKRRGFLEKTSLIEWSEEMLSMIERIYSGEFLEIKKSGEPVGIAFCFKSGDTLFIKEILSEDEECVSAALAESRGAKWARYAKRSDKYPSAMIYPGTMGNEYFNIALD